MEVKDRDNKIEVVNAVKEARHKMSDRVGARGVPVIFTGTGNVSKNTTLLANLVKGLQSYHEGAQNMVLKYTKADSAGSIGESCLYSWVREHARGKEKRDLLTDVLSTRGWEARAIIVVDMRGGFAAENCVMRSRTFVGLVTYEELKKDENVDEE